MKNAKTATTPQTETDSTRGPFVSLVVILSDESHAVVERRGGAATTSA